MKTVVIGLLGVTLDVAYKRKRWDRWRPTIGLCQQEALEIDRLELLYQSDYNRLANYVSADINHVSPNTKIVHNNIEFDDPWDFENVYTALYEFCKNYKFDTENEEYLIHITTGTHVAQICLFLLTETRHLPGKLVQTSPDHVFKKIAGDYKIIDLDLSKYDKISNRFALEKIDDISFLKSGIETKNKDFNRLIEKIEKVAINSIDPILLTGPTGAGKSQLAKRIYELKRQRKQIDGRFVELNCATLRHDSAMSSLFGHVKGGFTGAVKDREGALKSAHKGILFLDEIGELGLDEQAMLLRAIEDKVFIPVGSDKEIESDFQLLCGTNRDLSNQIKEGTFREDLLSRINLWTFKLPPLKDRLEDIEPNLNFELEKYTEKYRKNTTINKEARDKFLSLSKDSSASWRGNFRDLNGAVTRMATLAPSNRITKEVVEEEFTNLFNQWAPFNEIENYSIIKEVVDPDIFDDIDPFDKPQLAYVLEVCRDSKSLSDAGRKLFANSRKKRQTKNDSDRLKKYLAKFNIDWKDI